MRITMDGFRRYVAVKSQSGTADPETLAAVCPFSDSSVNEDELGHERFAAIKGTGHDNRLGYYIDLYGGHVTEGNFRTKGSSGGMGTWLLAEMFRNDMIDAAIHVLPSTKQGTDAPLCEFGITRSEKELLGRSKSSYYPVEMSQVLEVVRQKPGRYAIVGIPCFIKAVRLLTRQDPILAERITFAVALICGHLKSARYADFLAWQAGIAPGRLRSIDFRRKVPNSAANDYGLGFVGETDDGTLKEATQVHRHIFGSSWAYGFFMYGACEFCDDVVGETADVTVGDAWLPRYIKDWQGTNVVIVRNPRVAELIRAGISGNKLQLDVLGVEDVVASQAGCYRQRRDGLAYRLLLKDRLGVWRPRKRVEPKESHLNQRLRIKYAMRAKLVAASHEVFAAAIKEGTFDAVRRGLLPLIKIYDQYDRPAWRRFLSWGKRTLKKLLRLPPAF
jgi:coenzyme F420-reducing hydrogenase beta subunit